MHWCRYYRLGNADFREGKADDFGLYTSFERAGFEIVDRKSKNRPMVRYLIK